MQGSQVYSHDGPIGCRDRRYILTVDQSDAGIAGIFSQWTNRMQGSQVYSHGGPIGCRDHRYILTVNQSDAGTAGILSR
eukprot:8779627-Pyramimonas_sp.AAC.3